MPYKILIVEDNSANRLLLRDILVYHGYEIIEAENGADGIKAAIEQTPDIILMDLQMPVMNGYSAIRELKCNSVAKNIKIIAITSFAMIGDKEKAMECGADEYIGKPINTRTLPDMIKNMLK
ncbi:MAG: response regulator [Spirochaetota bacterium]